MNIKILTLNNSNFISLLEKKLDTKIIRFESGQFADTECFVKKTDIDLKDQNVLLIHQFSFDNESVNDQIIKLLYFVDLLKKMGTKKIDLVLPYYAYSRQDKNYNKKFPGFLFLIDKLFKIACVDKIFTFEIHKSDSIKSFETKTEEISLVDFGVSFFKENKNILFDGNDVCFLSPDEGRGQSIELIAKRAGVSFGYVKKERIEKDISIPLELVGNVENKNVIIIDDIIDTGGTALNACDLALKLGAKKVIGFFGHPVLSKNCVEKLEKSNFEKIFITDSVDVGEKIKNSKKIKQTTLTDSLVEFLKNKY
jgi:ribose-phosphate pyrophosphokinase